MNCIKNCHDLVMTLLSEFKRVSDRSLCAFLLFNSSAAHITYVYTYMFHMYKQFTVEVQNKVSVSMLIFTPGELSLTSAVRSSFTSSNYSPLHGFLCRLGYTCQVKQFVDICILFHFNNMIRTCSLCFCFCTMCWED